jgi:hypothetical protein
MERPFKKKNSIAILLNLAIRRVDDRLLKVVYQITLKFEPVAFFILDPSGH